MKTNSPEALAESFINGNISWVRAQLAGKRSLTAKTAAFLQEYAPNELASFLRLMSN